MVRSSEALARSRPTGGCRLAPRRQEVLHSVEDFIDEKQRPGENEECAYPVARGEVVVKVDQGDHQRHKLSEGHHEGYSQRGVL